MAEVSFLDLHDDDNVNFTGGVNDDVHSNLVVDLDSVSNWPRDLGNFVVYSSDLDFSPSDFSLRPRPSTFHDHTPTQVSNDDISEPDSILTSADRFDRENQVNFVMDLFHQRVEQSYSSSSRPVIVSDFLSTDSSLDPNFGVNDDMGSTNLELDLDLGLGFSTDAQIADNNSGFMVADAGDDFFVSRRGNASESGDSSTICGGEDHFFMGDLRVIDIDSDSEESVNGVVGINLNENDDYGLDNDNACDEDPSLQLHWESFRLEDHRDVTEDFEWEEVDDRFDEREVLSMFFDAEADDDASFTPIREEVRMERVDGLRNLEWEVLLNVHNFEGNSEIGYDGEFNLGDHDEYNYPAEYEMLFGQLAENEIASMGHPPASKTVVKNLPSVDITQEDVEKNNALCAVCKDEIKVGEKAMQLPCVHRYHGECILPWLEIRNTCPVCRYELVTDDPNYERRKSQRALRIQ